MKGFVDLIYGVRRTKKIFRSKNPLETIYASDGSKSILTSDTKVIERGMEWVTSQRAVVLLTNKRIICGKWSIPLIDISEAQLLKVRSLFGAGQVLRVRTNDANYQFGMQLNKEWTNQNILPLTIEEGKIKISPFSKIIRFVLVAYLIYWLFEKFIQS